MNISITYASKILRHYYETGSVGPKETRIRCGKKTSPKRNQYLITSLGNNLQPFISQSKPIIPRKIQKHNKKISSKYRS